MKKDSLFQHVDSYKFRIVRFFNTLFNRFYLMKTFVSILFVIFFMGCKEIQRVTSISTVEITETNYSSVTLKGEIKDLSNATHGEYGFFYSENPNPTQNDKREVLGSSPKVGSFTHTIDNLKPSKLYYVCAYVKEGDGYITGKTLEFTTLAAPVPTVTVLPITELAFTTAVFGGKIESANGDTILSSGIVWSTNPEPTINDYKIINNTGLSSFTFQLKDLTPGTKYYGRAYAFNNTGVGYSADIITFETKKFMLPTIVCNKAEEIKSKSATLKGLVTAIGDGKVFSCGFCYGTTPNIPLALKDTIAAVYNSTTKAFTVSITGLLPSTKYYVKAYARNFGGIGFSDTLSFTTAKNLNLPILSSSNSQDLYKKELFCQAQIMSPIAEVDEVGILMAEYPSNPYIGSNGTMKFPVNPIVQMLKTNLLYSRFTPNKKYNLRWYAMNNEGAVYGNIELITIPEPPAPIISSHKVYQILATSARLIGKELPNTELRNGTVFAEYGICWNTTGNPKMDGASFTTKSMVTVDYNSQFFEGKMTQLIPGTKYYARPWAKNSNGETYGDVIEFTTLPNNAIVKDYEGNEYATITIGTQTWLRDNLRSKFFANGYDIQGEYAYNYSEVNADIFGYLYPQGAAFYGTQFDACPTGYHIPSRAEWQTLIENSGGPNAANGHLREEDMTHWKTNYLADNSKGFCVLPDGSSFGGTPQSIYESARFWTSSKIVYTISYREFLTFRNLDVVFENSRTPLSDAFSIRCIKNNP